MSTIITFVENNPTILGIIIGIIIMIPIIFLFLCYYVFAPKNIFFTFGRENRAVHVMVGRKFSGKIILPSKTCHIDKERKIQESPKRTNLSFLGMYWIGIYPFYTIYKRHQQWLEWESNNQGKREIRVRDEMTPYLIVKPFEYAMLLEGGEDANGVPLNVYFTVILKAVHGTLPIFGNDNAYGQVQTLCKAQVLLLVKKKTFLNLGGDKENNLDETDIISHDEFSKILTSLNDKIPGRYDKKGIEEALGYQIVDAKLESVEIVGEQKDELLKASVKEYVAKETAKAEIEKARGDKEAQILRAEGEKIAGILGIDVEKYNMDIRNSFYELIKDKPYAQQIELAKKMFSDSHLTTFVSGKDVTPTINLGEK